LILIGIPAFNEEGSIAKVVILAKRNADRVVVVDDGSSDLTAEIAHEMGAEIIRHDWNMGYGACLATLFKKAREVDPDVLVTLDGDGQHDPRDVPRLVGPILDGAADVVIGSRFTGPGAQVPAYRRAGITAITMVSNLSGTSVTDSQSGLRAYGRRAIGALKPGEMGMGASTELLSKAGESGLRIEEVPVEIGYGRDTSTHNPVFHGIDVLLSEVKHLSIRHPLMFYGAPGAASLLVAAAFWWWTLNLFVSEHRVVTNVALISVASTVVGLILMAVAVILWVIISVVREGTG
jgi:glycosyltransferase involved in cell wall biosynthesis